MRVLALLGFLMSTWSCAGRAEPPEPEPEPPAVTDSDSVRWADDTLAAMSLEEKVGQLIFPRMDGLFVNESDPYMKFLIESAEAGRIGGVVFFKGRPYETAAIANRLQEAAKLPLLMASDYEFGAAMRVEGASRFPRAMAFGAGASVRDVEFQAEVTAREARAIGIQLLLNPVLDLNTNPENAVIDTRSYGEDPELASRFASAFVERAQALGVLTTAKHFPGHGATAIDSHFDLPVQRADRGSLEDLELRPFEAAIRSGVAAVMPAHMAVPSLDARDDRPATLSPEILGGLLRRDLGFDGLIVSDALEMAGARKNAWDGETVIGALSAGVDLLLVPPDPLVTYQAVLRAVRRGDLTEARIDESVRRLLRAKAELGLHERRTVDLKDLPRRVADAFVADRIERIAERAVTLVRNDDGLLPFRSERPPAIRLVELVPPSHPDLDTDVLATELERRAPRVERVRVRPRYDLDDLDLAPRSGEVVLVANYLRGAAATRVLSNLAPALAESTVVVASLESPYVLTAIPESAWASRAALVATYDDAPASQRALARALFAEIDVSGKLPVRLSDAYPVEHGLEVPNRRMNLQEVKRPSDVGFSNDGLREVVEVVRDAVADGATPGAVYLVARRGRIVLHGALGRTTYDEDAPAVTTDTLYDLASVTKVTATTTLAMIYVERGLLDLDGAIQSYIPEFRGEGKEQVLVRDLLAHSGGLLWWTDLFKRFEGLPPEEAKRGYVKAICEMPLDYPPRTKTSYSDLGLILLGEILERVTGEPLDVQAKREVFEPLGMDETMYAPSKRFLSRIAPTEVDPWRGRLVHGEVHDENAFGLGGVAPHAGLFSTARSLAPLAQMLLNGGVYDGERLLNPETIALFTRRARLAPESSRALGWDTPSEPSSAGSLYSAASFGHTGFTGTSIWIDPARELFAILLTNRVHPTRENRKIFDLRPAFHDAVMKAITDVTIVPRETAEP